MARSHQIVGKDYALREDIVVAAKASAIVYFFAVAVAVFIYILIGGFAAVISAIALASALTLQGFGAAVIVSWQRATLFGGASALNAAALAGTLILLAKFATAVGAHAGYVLRLVS